MRTIGPGFVGLEDDRMVRLRFAGLEGDRMVGPGFVGLEDDWMVATVNRL